MRLSPGHDFVSLTALLVAATTMECFIYLADIDFLTILVWFEMGWTLEIHKFRFFVYDLAAKKHNSVGLVAPGNSNLRPTEPGCT